MSTVAALLEQAQAHSATGAWREVEALCRQIHQTDPAQPEAWVLLAHACRATGRLEEAIAGYERARLLKPDDPLVVAGLQTALAIRDNNQGLSLAMEGRLDEALACFERAIERKPDYPQALHNLGVTLEKQSQLERAVACYRRALMLKPDYAQAHRNLGVALERLRDFAAAEASYRAALERMPDFFEAHNGLGVTLEKQSRPAEAEACFRRAIALRPDFAEAHSNLAGVLEAQDKLVEAHESLHRALALNPACVEAHNNLAHLLKREGKLDEAMASYRRALELAPGSADAFRGLGDALQLQNKLDDALVCLERAAELEPESAELHSQIGLVLERQNKVDLALASVDRALELDPDNVSAQTVRGFFRMKQGQVDEAIRGFRQVLDRHAEVAQLHLNYGLALLLKGDFAGGWPEYEWRLICESPQLLQLPQPRWTGEPLAGRTILVRGEQGLGDCLQFVRYAEMVAARGGRVIVESRKQLGSLLARTPGVERVVASGEPLPEFDVFVAMLSLPGIFQTTLDTIPNRVPYLFPDAALVEARKAEFAAEPALKVGIAWQGDPNNKSNAGRSFPARLFERIARFDGVRLYSLQVGSGREELAAWPAPSRIIDLADRLGDFHNTAAIVSHLDLVITLDSAPAHLAAGLAIPTWVAIPFAPDWRWLLDRSDTPWYPTMRLYRQTQAGDWQTPFAQMERDLAALVKSRTRGATP